MSNKKGVIIAPSHKMTVTKEKLDRDGNVIEVKVIPPKEEDKEETCESTS